MIPENFYKSKIDQHSKEKTKLSKKIKIFAFLRLASFIIAIFLLIKGFNTNFYGYYIAAVATISIFLKLVIFHKNLSDKRKLTEILLSNYKNEISALNANFSAFNSGKEYLDQEHEFTYDLDIFGDRSLFQYMNRTCTKSGEKKLASDIINSPANQDEIQKNHSILKELEKKQELLQLYRATGMLIEDNDEDRDKITKWLDNKHQFLSFPAKIILYSISLLNTGIIITGIFIPGVINYLLVSIFVSWLFYGIYMKSINKYHENITKKQKLIGKYVNLSKILAKADFKQETLKNITKESKNSIQNLKQLDKLLNFLDTRLNILIGIILNTLFLFDLHIILKIEKWKHHYSESIPDFFTSHTLFDSLSSKAIFCFNHSDFSWPEISEQTLIAQELGHPLLSSKNRICNNFSLSKDEKVLIITGANMAGKSTFLRTIGTNIILAGIGVKVCAKEFSFKPLKLITGMRTTDSLADSESYFFAELKRLQKIVQGLKNGDQYFILLDEILKGTNSTDKHVGSKALVQQLVNTNASCIIATHDLELGKIEKDYPVAVKNYRFESLIKNDELLFDYKLKKGIAQNMNASFLMKKMGIIQ